MMYDLRRANLNLVALCVPSSKFYGAFVTEYFSVVTVRRRRKAELSVRFLHSQFKLLTSRH